MKMKNFVFAGVFAKFTPGQVGAWIAHLSNDTSIDTEVKAVRWAEKFSPARRKGLRRFALKWRIFTAFGSYDEGCGMETVT